MVEPENTTKLTYEDYRQAPGDQRWELLYGELVTVPSPSTAHRKASEKLFLLIQAHLDETGLGRVFPSPIEVVLSDTNVVQPDLLFVSTQQEHIVTDDNIQGAPDLVVQIISRDTLDRDWKAKFDIYKQHGVREYWIVSPGGKRIWVTSGDVAPFSRIRSYGVFDDLVSSALEGFRVPVQEIFPQSFGYSDRERDQDE